MDDFVNVVRRDTRLDFCCRNIQNFSSQAADFPHAFLFFFIQYRDVMSADKFLLGSWNTIPGIIGARNGLWNGAAW